MRNRMMRRWRLPLLVTSAVLLAVACASLKTAKPLFPVKEYERLLVGRMDADYVGNERCLSACHSHDHLRRDFEASTMGAQLSAESGLPLVDCESCHGPGSLAIEEITAEKVKEDEAAGVETACKYDTLIAIDELPPGARNLMCLRCHTGNATFNLHEWSAGAHAMADVTCSHCHPVHAGPDMIVRTDSAASMCLSCHESTVAEFQLPSHHPLLEGKMGCGDCHDPHGTTNEALLREDCERDTCAACHADKQGPFALEHADLLEDCSECHQPHGSVANNLLHATEPYLCLQCHQGHWVTGIAGASSAESKGALYSRCSDCHATIHGTDVPSATGRGTFVQ